VAREGMDLPLPTGTPRPIGVRSLDAAR